MVCRQPVEPRWSQCAHAKFAVIESYPDLFVVVEIEWLIDSPDQGYEGYPGEIQPFFPTRLIHNATAMSLQGIRACSRYVERRR